MQNVNNIINQKKIFDILEKNRAPSEADILKILRKAELRKGLSLEEAGILANIQRPRLIKKMFEIAGRIKNEIYGERLVLFAPLYVSNFCVNNCKYCGFRNKNKIIRRKLSLKEIGEQTESLIEMGHKRLLLEFGEHSKEAPIDYVVDAIKVIYGVRVKKGNIRRVNVNIAATTEEDYRKLKKAGIGTYQLFQETYHRDTYEKLHFGPKADFERQLFAINRAFKAGIDDVGLGALFGLYDWRFEILALISHAQYLDKKFGIGPHTFSVPRFQQAPGVSFSPEYPVGEKELLKIIAILRIAVPYTGMIISTRERPELRKKAFEIGISQTSAGSKTSVGGYGQNSKLKVNKKIGRQFQLQDERALDEVVESVLKQGLLPSFCTACYRSARTGKNFMNLAKSGDIHNFCRPNALLTFKEYLEDFAAQEIKSLGVKVIKKYLAKIPNSQIQKETKIRLAKIENGERDLYF
jgi:2-iminoacetate synthase